MKLPIALSLALFASSAVLLGQDTKGKPLASSDKTFIKNSTESIFVLTSLADKVRQASKDATFTESTTALSKKMGTELGKIWAEVGAIASSAGEQLPVELKGSDKTKVGNLSKLKEGKFEKEFAELSAKESKQLVGILENGAKMAQNPELKAIAEKWVPAVKIISDEATALSKTAGKK